MRFGSFSADSAQGSTRPVGKATRPGMRKALVTAGLALATVTPARALSVDLAITVDNSYALFYGTRVSTLSFVGSDFTWQTTETYHFDLPNQDYIYVVTESALATAQGFLGQFTTLANGQKYYSNDLNWQVAATGRRGLAPYTGSVASFQELNDQIVKANAGQDPSGGWVRPTAGNANGASPWGTRPGIDAAAHWVWYDKKKDGSDPTIGGFNDDEYLIFRIPVAVPEPSTPALLAVGLVLVAAAARRRRRAPGP